MRLFILIDRFGIVVLVLPGAADRFLILAVVTRNQIISYAYGNLWRLYTTDTTRMVANPTSSQQTAVKSLLAGVIMGHLGVLQAVLSSVLHRNQHFSLSGS